MSPYHVGAIAIHQISKLKIVIARRIFYLYSLQCNQFTSLNKLCEYLSKYHERLSQIIQVIIMTLSTFKKSQKKYKNSRKLIK
jgi:hypothetical protein